ncbi:MAG TPA: hypothetical protein VFP72_17335 [Kineosporiaceae bacterium]|nr:hypothetical protein [Kineosporiaceae bacterium]
MRPDHDHIAAVRESFWLLGDVDLLSQRFDARLACLTPRAESAFARQFPRGGERFVTAVLRAVDALGPEHDPVPGADPESQVAQLAVRLMSAGMQRRDFLHLGSSLHRAVRDSYAGEWTDELDQAWNQVQRWLVSGLQAEGAAGEAAAPTAVIDLTGQNLAARLERLGALAG